ncbi:MAG: transporter substrate-binding domain-containing protein [Candidatus Delongbacteria bacterium]|nr:transporter substrate-binding domain-containing protein [Candidatus Delongbacteria bacterium]MBN2835922.1 transporter substrate-binding domain-containing protein [Candidatus Delongbacteria bacterium]
MRVLSMMFVVLMMTNITFSMVLNLATLESPPQEFTDSEGNPNGFNIEVIREAAKRAGFDIKVVFHPWKRALQNAFDGEVDGIIDAGYNEERALHLLYPSENIYTEEIFLFKRKGTDLILKDNLSNSPEISVGVGRGFYYGGIVQDILDRKGFKNIEEVNSYEQNIKKLIAGRFDALVANELNAVYEAKKLGVSNQIEKCLNEKDNQPYLLSSSKTYLAFSKKTVKQELVDKFDQALKEIKKDGTYDKIKKKYM